MSTTEASTEQRQIAVPEGTDDYVSVAFFARDPEGFARVKAQHPDGHETTLTPTRREGVFVSAPIWNWSEGEVHATCHGPYFPLLRAEADR